MPGEWSTLYSKVQWWIRRLSRWHTGTLPPLWLTFQPGDHKMCNGGSHQQVKRNQIPHSPTAIELVSGRWAGWLTLMIDHSFYPNHCKQKLGHHSNYYQLLLFTEVIRNSFFLLSDHTAWPHSGVVKTWFVWPWLMKMPKENLLMLLMALRLVLVGKQ